MKQFFHADENVLQKELRMQLVVRSHLRDEHLSRWFKSTAHKYLLLPVASFLLLPNSGWIALMHV